MIVDHDRRDRRDEAERGRQQRFGDAGRDHREIGGMRLGNADEGIHDAPHRAEQADERRGGADGGEHAGAARDLPRHRGLDPLQPQRDALLEAVVDDAAGQAGLARRGLDDLRHGVAAVAGIRARPRPASCRSRAGRGGAWPRSRLRRSSMVLASQTVQVTSEAKARPTITAFTTMSAFTNMPHGDRLRGSSALSAAARAASGSNAQRRHCDRFRTEY